MIKILILDDAPEKAELVKKFLCQECNIKPSDITLGYSIKDGRKILYSESFDLLLLDLVMPRDSESEPSAEESVKFLDEIYYNSQINIPVHIIGLTQFDDLIRDYIDKFDDRLWHLVNFSFTNSLWKDKLKAKICHLISTKSDFQSAILSSTNFDIAVITALEQPELSEFLNLPLSWKSFQVEGDPLVYHKASIETIAGNSYKIVICALNRMGMQAAATVSARIIATFKVKYLFMTGICAGVRESGLNYGDIVIAENLTDYGSGKLIEDGEQFLFKPEPHQFATDQGLISLVSNFIRNPEEILKIQSRFRGTIPQTLLKAKIGPVASGAYVVASKSFMQNLLVPNRKLLAVDMEGFGIYLARQYYNLTKCLFIKSICDFGDKEKHDDYQLYASYTSSAFLHAFIVNSL